MLSQKVTLHMNTKKRIAVSAKSGVSLATIIKYDKDIPINAVLARAIEAAVAEIEAAENEKIEAAS